MMHWRILAAAGALLLWSATAEPPRAAAQDAAAQTAAAQNADARALVKQVIDSLPKKPFVATMRLTTPAGRRDLEVRNKIIGGGRASLIEVTAPPELKGIRFLFLEHPDRPPEQYVKVAASRRGVLVTDEASKQPFLGSSFAVADLVEPEIDAYSYRFTGNETVLERQSKLVEATAKRPREELYGKMIAALDPKDLLVLKRQFFDQQNRLVKVWEVDRVTNFDGNWIVMDQRMTEVPSKATSRLEVISMRFDVDVPDGTFTPEYLVR